MPPRFGRPAASTWTASSRPRTRVFVSFDYDNDRDLKTMLIGQGKLKGSPFYIEDWSIKQESASWRTDARRRISRSSLVIVICGLHTHRATGVAAEVKIAREEKVRYLLLRGRKDGWVRRPVGTSWFFDDIHPWTWKELERMTRAKG